MKILLTRSLWGYSVPTHDWLPILSEIKHHGFTGVECSLGDISKNIDDSTAQKAFVHALESLDLVLICGIYTSWQDYEGGWKDVCVDEHVQQYEKQLAIAVSLKPIHINVHSGSDTWTIEQATEYFQRILPLEQNCPISISHETHRGRVLYSPWPTLQLLKAFPSLKLTLDLSHWVLVCERLLDTEFDMKKVIERCEHIHARVGTAQSSQVVDPKDPCVKEEKNYFEKVWLRCLKSMKERGMEIATVTPEYGPQPYTPGLPFSGLPLSDVKQVIVQEVIKWNGLLDHLE